MTKYRVLFLVIILGFLMDQGTKIWARNTLRPEGYPRFGRETAIPVKTVIKGYVELRYSENPGSAFGIFRNMSGARTVLFAAGLLFWGFLWFWLYKLPYRAFWLTSRLGLLFAGAAGNIFDRLTTGRISDFIVLEITTATGVHQWPTFNLADAMLVCGGLLLTIDWPYDAIFRELP